MQPKNIQSAVIDLTVLPVRFMTRFFIFATLVSALALPSLASAATVRCELDVSDSRIERGDEVTLSWETTNATDVKIEDDRNHTLLDTDDMKSGEKRDFLDGEMTVKPAVTTTYTLTAERSSSDRECEVTVTVRDTVASGSTGRTTDSNILVFEERYYDPAPMVAGVYLSQVPYTGFGPDSVLGWLFYTLAALWVAYFVYYRIILKRRA